MARNSVAGLLLALASCAALAQPLGPTWLGNWQPAEASPPTALAVSGDVTIATQGNATRMRIDGGDCELRYDGQVSQAGLLAHLRQLRDWQLMPEHWPEGTDPASLVGLRQEFYDAEQMLLSVEPDNYRRVRAKGSSCDSADDVFWILHQGQRLFRLRFLAAGLGTEIVLFTRKP